MAIIVTYRPDHFAGVEALWQMVFPDDPPWNAAASAIPAKLAVQPELFLVALEGAQIVGSIMAGYDGHRGWLYALAVHPDQRRRGIAKQLAGEAIGRLRLLGCRKVNLQVRSGNDAAVAFWRSTGFSVEERVSMGRPLSSA
jgi:ribosomal protein S18 acetylase RimI-like enzyme